ncbi:hypothetical protein SUGI_1185990, partial [Cryptomeria japonica]
SYKVGKADQKNYSGTCEQHIRFWVGWPKAMEQIFDCRVSLVVGFDSGGQMSCQSEVVNEDVADVLLAKWTTNFSILHMGIMKAFAF